VRLLATLAGVATTRQHCSDLTTGT
jgi:hypothetical protein